MLFWQTELIVGWQVLQQSSMYAVIWGGKKKFKGKNLPQDTGGCSCRTGMLSLTHGRCRDSGTASAAGDRGCAAAAESLQGWPADANS